MNLKKFHLIILVAFSVCKYSYSQNLKVSSPDTVCIKEILKLTDNNTQDYPRHWGFTPKTSITKTPRAVLTSHFDNKLNTSVMTEPVFDGINYYLFITNYNNSTLVKANYGSSYLNTPTITNLGNFQNQFPIRLEGIKIKKEGENWLAFLVGSNGLYRLNFGKNLNNNNPTYTDMGNIGGLAWPHEMYIFKHNNNWFGFVANRSSNYITRYSFGNSLLNVPDADHIKNIGIVSGSSGLELVQDRNSDFYLFITDIFGGKILRVKLGADLMNTSPTYNEFPSTILSGRVLRGISILKDCDSYVGYISHESRELVKLTFDNGLAGNITFNSLGDLGGTINISNDISKSIMTDTVAYLFATNVNNTIVRLEFPLYGNSGNVYSTQNNSVPTDIEYIDTGWQNITYTLNFGEANQKDTCFNIYVKKCSKPDLENPNDSSDCSLFIPNAFTPDANGLNDFFKAYYNCLFDDWKLNIYSRWGENLKELTSPEQGWDGIYKGNKVPEGVYMYLLQYTKSGEVKSEAGTFHILYLH